MEPKDKEEGAAPVEESGRFRELDELQREVAQRIKDNQRFLAGFLDEDYEDEEEDDDSAGDDLEEL